MATQSVQQLLDDIRLVGDEQYALVESVRARVKVAFPDVSEEVKYGGILFSSGVQFCGVFAYKNHVSVEFSKGANIKDPLGHLEGGGKGRRHIKITCTTDIKEKMLDHYLPLALQAAENDA